MPTTLNSIATYILRGVTRSAIVAVFVLAGLCVSAFAQDTGQIEGTVTDQTGAAVTGATVTATNIGTDASHATTTSNTGAYVFTGLPPASYEVTITAPGFTTWKARTDVTVGGRLTLDSKLTLGSSTTSVEVFAEGGAQVNTQTQELSQVVSREQVSQLPSLTRNPYDFVALSGNISSGDNSGPMKGQNGPATPRGVGFNINGQRSTGTEILLDGVENTSVFAQGVGILVPIDAVQEFRVVTSNFEPQYGRASGGVVNVATRSGSNNFHGNVWEFNRLAAYTANTVTNSAIFAMRTVQNTAPWPIDENHAQSTTRLLAQPSTMRQATMTATATMTRLKRIFFLPPRVPRERD